MSTGEHLSVDLYKTNFKNVVCSLHASGAAKVKDLIWTTVIESFAISDVKCCTVF